MPEHRVGTQEEWQVERDELLAKEKELTRLNDELAERRRQLPWVPVEKEYSFETEDGTDHRPRGRAGNGLLRPARPDADGAQRAR
jgi:predicted dithiol-disulfide oxidoreductase (DUF899 family)